MPICIYSSFLCHLLKHVLTIINFWWSGQSGLYPCMWRGSSLLARFGLPLSFWAQAQYVEWSSSLLFYSSSAQWSRTFNQMFHKKALAHLFVTEKCLVKEWHPQPPFKWTTQSFQGGVGSACLCGSVCVSLVLGSAVVIWHCCCLFNSWFMYKSFLNLVKKK